MFGFSSLLAAVAVIGVSCCAGTLSQEVTCPAQLLFLLNTLLTGTNASDNCLVYLPCVESALLLRGGWRKGISVSVHWESKLYAAF